MQDSTTFRLFVLLLMSVLIGATIAAIIHINSEEQLAEYISRSNFTLPPDGK